MAKATVGVSDHGGWAVLVAVSGGALVDRRRVTLVGEGLPAIPHHTEAQLLPLDEGMALVERVRVSAEKCSLAALKELAGDVKISTIALRVCPELPATIEERITDYWAQNNADWIMYRQALAKAARELGWRIAWFDAKKVLSAPGVDKVVRETGKKLGPPWNADHRLAMAAAITAVAAPAVGHRVHRRSRRTAASGRTPARSAPRSRARRS
ncbi:MAG: hypothetical protein AB7T06_42210 [Kofleriaceae bacterium]